MNDQRGVTSRGEGIADFVKYDEESLLPVCPTTVVDIGNRSKLKHLLLGGCLIISYNFLMKLVKLKYHGEKESPFEKHRFLMCAYLVALIMVGLAFAILGYDYGCSLYKKSFPRHVYKVVKIVMYLSGIIALLSVILMLIID